MRAHDAIAPMEERGKRRFSELYPRQKCTARAGSGGEVLSENINRRSFLRAVAGSTVALASVQVLGIPADHSLAPGCKVLTVAQADIVNAIAEQIVPGDDSPSARQAGVVFYIDGVLSGRFGGFYKDRYQQGLRMVDEASHKRFARNFVGLDREQQLSILKALESADATGDVTAAEGRHFFALILQHTMEGYYGDPEHGGNRGNASWQMIGFEG
jgi:gluconate 2-dehydrogenase gamma chain